MLRRLQKTAKGNGWMRLRHAGRRYEIRRSERQWEIAIWDNENHTWLLCSGETPEGVFATRKSALDALLKYLAPSVSP